MAARTLACPVCRTPLVRGEGQCVCGDFFFAGRVRGPTRGGQLRVGGRNYTCEHGGKWQRLEWELKDVRGNHAPTPDNGRVGCPCCEQWEARAGDYRSMPGAMHRWSQR